MAIIKHYAITVLDVENIHDMNSIILNHADISLKSSSHTYFDNQPIDSTEIVEDMTFFQIDAEDEASLDKKFKALTEDLNQLTADYAIRDEDTGAMLVYLKFVGQLNIKFDNVEIIKEDTYKKIDALKSLKTDFGICKGYKPNFRVMEGQSIKGLNIKPESIYLLCHSQENLMKLKDLMYEEIMKIDSNFELEFIQFGGEDPEFNTKFNCLDLDRSKYILEDLENKK